ncbi:glutamate receptor ionotropic, delta-1-like isoform X2 [Panulirus ornatus]|uniref:glutamate receptor ionotropic, delta-1-like isoform X2 n=1 Tax=Panulirus ornatus TaxID=150431 RepID=UPI003A892CC8
MLNDRVDNMMGHRFQLATRPYFPYMDYRTDTDEPESRVTPIDSLDFRILDVFAATLNFTYEINEAPNRAFGDYRNGSFTGIIGKLEREEADLSTIVAPTPGRLQVVQFCRVYESDKMVITSLKPALLPASLSLIRPFEGELWLGLLVSVVAWGVILWLLQRAWRWMSGRRGVRLNTALLYGWRTLLEQPPTTPPSNMTGRVLVGWWLVFCLIITTGFRSSLIAHLTVQGRSKTLDNFRDLLDQGDWRWGTEPWQFSGATLVYFSTNTDPVVKQINDKMEVLLVKEALQKVLEGGFSFISVKNYVRVIVDSWYTDAYGETPFYISHHGIHTLACFGWGFRRGAPFYDRFVQLMSRVEDAGIISYWTDEVIARRVRENRRAEALDHDVVLTDKLQVMIVWRRAVGKH